jgi:hypothetical protein
MGNARGAYFSDSTVSPNTTYTYTIYPHDAHLNLSTRAVTVTTPAANVKDPRKVGVRPLGTYWGASPENIDLQSGNLSFSLPTVTAQGRGGTAVPFRLSYNSQNWRKDPAKAWLLGTDVGFGFGWKMLAGALTPVYSDWFTIHHFVYTDATGAEYDLDVNVSGIWRSKTGLFVEYDATARRLYFPGGSYWECDCTANGTEADAGTLYPTRLVDTNGNEIKLRYQGGLHYGGVNGSARVTEVEDVRSVVVGPVYKSYTFTYNNDAIPHLTSIGTHVPGDNSNIRFTYHGSTSLLDPFASANFGSAVDLATMSVPGSGVLQFAMTYYSGSHEFRKITMPYGGTIEWEYGAKTLAGDRTIREVTKRTLNAADAQGDKIYTLSHNDTADLSLLAHAYTVVQDASGVADKKYLFSTTGDWTLGLLTGLQERKVAGPVTLRESTMTWQRTANLNPYITATVETMDPGQSYAQSSKVEQTLNDHGNLTERKQYGYYAPAGTPPLARTFTYAYLATSNYTSRHIWNRLLTATVLKPNGTPITLVSNGYDSYLYGSVNAVSNPSVLRQHDTANYGSGFLFRGNVTSSTRPGSTVTMTYDYTGAVLSTSDGYGHGATQTRDANRNYAVPSAMTAGSLSSSFSWNGANEMTSTTGPNGATASASYDSYLVTVRTTTH